MTYLINFGIILFCLFSIILEIVSLVFDYKVRKFKTTNKQKYIRTSRVFFILAYCIAVALYIFRPTTIGRVALIISILPISYIMFFYMNYKLGKTYQNITIGIIAFSVLFGIVIGLLNFGAYSYEVFRVGKSTQTQNTIVQVHETDKIKIAQNKYFLRTRLSPLYKEECTSKATTALLLYDDSNEDLEKKIVFYSYDNPILDNTIWHEIKESEFTLNVVGDTNIEFPYFVLTTTVISQTSSYDPFYNNMVTSKHYDIFVAENDIERFNCQDGRYLT